MTRHHKVVAKKISQLHCSSAFLDFFNNIIMFHYVQNNGVFNHVDRDKIYGMYNEHLFLLYTCVRINPSRLNEEYVN